MYPLYVKRFLDIVIASLGLIVASPAFILIAICLLVQNRGKLFFVQIRPGKDEVLFPIIKFKTMNDKIGEDGMLLPDADRLTKLGKIIRKTSLDELPQLLNVLKGDMSLIGPRPLLVSYLPLYNEEQQRRHSVKPGITGWAQVNGRNTISWKRKFEYDVWYVDHLSFSLDTKIIWLTILKVLKSDGISSETSATMEAFSGNEP
jgi:lipopolysaccharide/colanic/teichoic acid biosynthesis glycosyltransferase